MAVDQKQAMEFIQRVLRNGTPDWMRFPQHYKAMVDEWHREAQENLLAECSSYKTQDQDILADPAGRRVNMMAAAVFMRKLRNAGLRCFSHDSELRDGSASLFALHSTPRGGEFEPVCSIQVPLMWEWSTIRVDPKTNLPSGFRDIGWRSAVRCLITQGVWTEEHAHRVFGAPRVCRQSTIYRRMLWEYRNAAKWRNYNAA
jgi:hypothetical protein